MAVISLPTQYRAADSVDAPQRKRLGELLIERGKLDAGGLERALRVQQESGEKIGTLLVTLALCAQKDVAEAWRRSWAFRWWSATGYPEFPILEERISPRFLREAHALPVREDERELALAMADPTDAYTIGAFRMVTGREVKPMVADPVRARRGLGAALRGRPHRAGQIVGDVEQRDELAFDADIQQLKAFASEAPVIRLVSLLITNALRRAHRTSTSSPSRDRLAVRYRIDGVLHEIGCPPPSASAGRDHLAHQDHGRTSTSPSAACRRTAASGCACSGTARSTSACRRCRRCTARRVVHAYARQARRRVSTFDAARLRGRPRCRCSASASSAAARHHPRHRADRLRQDDDALRRARASSNTTELNDPHDRGPGRIPAARHQPGRR